MVCGVTDCTPTSQSFPRREVCLSPRVILSGVSRFFSFERCAAQCIFCWSVNTPHRDELSPYSKEFELDEKISTNFSFHLWMVGREPRSARPTVIFTSKSDSYRTKVIRILQANDILAKFPGMSLKSMDRMPAEPMGMKQEPYPSDIESRYSGPCEQQIYLRDGGKNVCGSSIQIGVNHEATLGGVLIINGIYFGFTSLHPRTTEDSSVETFTEDNSSFQFDDDSDVTTTKTQSLRSLKPVSTRMSFHRSSVDLSSGSVEAQGSRVRETQPYHENGDARPRQIGVVKEAGVQNDLDYEIFRIDDPVLHVPNRINLPPTPEEPHRLLDIQTPGDCGAWVVDAHSGALYGHVVAGNSSLRRAYIIPAINVMNDILQRFQHSPILPSISRFESIPLSQTQNEPYHFSRHSFVVDMEPQAFLRSRLPSSQANLPPPSDLQTNNRSIEVEEIQSEYLQARGSGTVHPSTNRPSWVSAIKRLRNSKPIDRIEDRYSGNLTETLEEFPPGYPRLASFINSDDDFAIFRRFGTLRTPKLLLQDAESKKLRKASKEIHRNLFNYIHNRKPLGAKDMGFIYHGDDFVCVGEPSPDSVLDNAIQSLASTTRLGSIFTTSDGKKSEDPLIRYYFKTRLSKVTRIIVTLTAVAILLVPIYILFALDISTRLLLTIVLACAMSFAVVLSLVTHSDNGEDRMDLFRTVLLYTAVLAGIVAIVATGRSVI
ncbi:hypothetical protein G7Y89_g8839 [Cudoniella acicularis]|uniref:DUF6594 domain-containing protein n=1 Tax=Cudoniella acicularis TaxID=354080 RepID=A0A8H4RFW3_9HELO|nr:hypothetical protein G7Y89_g8839 [Cudoniella acicularis]